MPQRKRLRASPYLLTRDASSYYTEDEEAIDHFADPDRDRQSDNVLRIVDSLARLPRRRLKVRNRGEIVRRDLQSKRLHNIQY
eukprot:1178520-Prorocentrum_minimum.AAC.3